MINTYLKKTKHIIHNSAVVGFSFKGDYNCKAEQIKLHGYFPSCKCASKQNIHRKINITNITISLFVGVFMPFFNILLVISSSQLLGQWQYIELYWAGKKSISQYESQEWLGKTPTKCMSRVKYTY